MTASAPVLPISPLLPQILASLQTHPRLVLEAPPGAGKTTQVPLALLDATWLAGRKILMLEPRRIAARAAAQFMARQLGESVGETVGYRIRFEARVSAHTRIEVVTEGILNRLIQSDPELARIGVVVFDEFHERHLAGDLGAALALEVQSSLRPDLRLMVMSATLDGERMAQWFDAPHISSEGRGFPVSISYPPARAQETLEQQLARITRQALAETDGDVLAFLPGRREIGRTRALLQNTLDPADVDVLMLHGELSQEQQQRALDPADPGRRRVVLATNVAESSVTLPGIRTVIDSGLAREPRFDPASGFSRLQTVNISQASADQRAGRAGRVAAGSAYRLWPQSRRLEPSRAAEIAHAELSGMALELAAWGVTAGSETTLRWLDPPPPGALAQARDLLQALGAIEATGRIMPLGRRMLELGASVRLAAAALRAPTPLAAVVADVLALMETRSPLRGEQAHSDDFRQRVTALHAWRDRRLVGASSAADSHALQAIEQASRGWRRRLQVRSAASGRSSASCARDTRPSMASGRSSASCARDTRPSMASGLPDSHTVGDLLLHAFPDRIAHRDDSNPLRYTLANGRGARLHEQTALQGEPWIVVLELRHERGDSLIQSAAPFDPAILERDFGGLFQRERVRRWNDERGAVEAFDEQRFGAIVLERRSVPVTADDALPGLLAAIHSKGLDVLPWSEGARSLRLRIQFLREWTPELQLPDVSDVHLLATLDSWLLPCLDGVRRLDALDPGALATALGNLLTWEQRRALDAQAPERLPVPSGRQLKLDYSLGASPVLPVKLQELFGLASTPCVAAGRVAVTLHLLSPASRPIQVTQDLKGFWERTYPEVKKELKGRYPRHPWPDDPWQAAPTHRAKPRGT